MVSDPLYPFASRWFDQPGGRMHYLDEGQGPPVVMLHGNPTWSFYFRRLVTELRGTHRVIVPDHLGCGRSDKPGDERYTYTLASRIDDVERLLAQLGVVRDVTLVLHDWGGMIGMGWAHRHAEAMRRFVILNTGAFPLPAAKPLPFTLKLARNWRIGEWLVRRWNFFAGAAARWCATRRPLPPDVRAMLLSPYDSWEHRIATIRFVQDIPLGPQDRAWPVVTAIADGLGRFVDHPMLICWGMQDFVFDHHFLAEWQRRFPKAAVHRFDDCGHYILEDAADEVAQLVHEFVAKHPV